MIFQKSLVHGFLIRRYKRFLADVKLDNGQEIVAHCTNSGSMNSCLEDEAEVYLTPVDDPKRKTKFTWEMIKINQQWVGINTRMPNVLVFDAIRKNQIKQLPPYQLVKREVKFADSRFDVYAENETECCFVEVKNVTMKVGHKALFPDAKTKRGLKHLNTLIEVKKQGLRAIMFYVIQRMDVDCFGTANEIDPEYAATLKFAIEQGVEVIAMQAQVTPLEINLIRELPIDLD